MLSHASVPRGNERTTVFFPPEGGRTKIEDDYCMNKVGVTMTEGYRIADGPAKSGKVPISAKRNNQ